MVQRTKSGRINKETKEGGTRLSKVAQLKLMEYVELHSKNKEELDEIFDAKYRFASICRDGNLNRVEKIYDWIKDDTRILFNGFCAACLSGQINIIKFFFKEQRFKLSDYKDNSRLTLFYACHNDNVELVELLISKDRSLFAHIVDAFTCALSFGNFFVADFFLKLGADRKDCVMGIRITEESTKYFKIYDARRESDLVEYLLDNDVKVRIYAEYKLKELERR